MLDARSFRLTTQVRRQDLEEHPVWTAYEDPDDRTAILSWGIDGDWLTRTLCSFAGFEQGYAHPFYPVLDLATSSGGILLVKAEITFANGQRALGQTYGSHAFGIFVGEDCVLFNLNLAREAAASAAVVLRAYSRDREGLFPARCRRAIDVPGEERVLELDDFWSLQS